MRVPEDLIKAINEMDSFNNKIQTNNFNNDYFIVQDDHSHKNEDEGRTHFHNENNYEDESYDESDNSQQLNGMELNKIVN